MTSQLPVPVEPVDGAVVVEFPWDAATDAVEALARAASEVDNQLGTRPQMVETLDDWVGSYRTDFDVADIRTTTVGMGLKDELVLLASAIVTEAEEANQQQRNNNTIADNERQGLVPPRGGRV